MDSVIFLIAWRFLTNNIYKKTISPMVFVCCISIFIGSFSLALVTAIMHGFEVAVHEKMQGIHAQVTMRAPENQQLNVNALKSVLANEFPEITSWSPNSTRYAIIQTEDDEISIPTVVIIKAIDASTEPQVSSIQDKIITPRFKPLSVLMHNDDVLIGKTLSHNSNIKTGDSIELLFADNNKPDRNKISLNSINATVGGLFNSGVDEFDSGVIFCSFHFLEQIFPAIGIEQINIKLKPGTNEKEIIKKLKNRLQLDVYSWKDLYQPLVSALELEKWVSFFILALITLVASMNIISLLSMHIMQKRFDIAILKVMGMSYQSIRTIFLLIGMFITSFSALSGLGCAWLASRFLKNYPFIELPDVYYVSHLPVKMEWQILFTVFIVVLSLGFAATWIATSRTKNLMATNVLRFER